ncbi:GRIFN protein, partial [Columbina picui]|nr:GRIFN protein [Columbina picui]
QFEALYPEGMCPGWSIVVKGETSSRTSILNFELSLIPTITKQKLNYSLLLPKEGMSTVCGSSGTMYRPIPGHSLTRWQQGPVGMCSHIMNLTQSLFQVEIYSDQDYFHIFINENKILQYKHRQKQLSSITKLQILNDIAISSVEITKRGL